MIDDSPWRLTSPNWPTATCPLRFAPGMVPNGRLDLATTSPLHFASGKNPLRPSGSPPPNDFHLGEDGWGFWIDGYASSIVDNSPWTKRRG